MFHIHYGAIKPTTFMKAMKCNVSTDLEEFRNHSIGFTRKNLLPLCLQNLINSTTKLLQQSHINRRDNSNLQDNREKTFSMHSSTHYPLLANKKLSPQNKAVILINLTLTF